jgi:hypothetical protein
VRVLLSTHDSRGGVEPLVALAVRLRALNTHRASIGLPPVDHVRNHILSDQPWLAADPALAP